MSYIFLRPEDMPAYHPHFCVGVGCGFCSPGATSTWGGQMTTWTPPYTGKHRKSPIPGL